MSPQHISSWKREAGRTTAHMVMPVVSVTGFPPFIHFMDLGKKLDLSAFAADVVGQLRPDDPGRWTDVQIKAGSRHMLIPTGAGDSDEAVWGKSGSTSGHGTTPRRIRPRSRAVQIALPGTSQRPDFRPCSRQAPVSAFPSPASWAWLRGYGGRYFSYRAMPRRGSPGAELKKPRFASLPNPLILRS